MMSSWYSWLKSLAYGSVGICGLGLGLLYTFQEKMLYVPRIPGPMANCWLDPTENDLGYENDEVITKDHVKLHAWLLYAKNLDKESRSKRPTLLFFQENAGNISFRLPFLRLMVYYLNCNIYAVSYRGYGLSEGKPNEAGLKLDAKAALSRLLQRDDVSTDKIFVYGRSLGGAVAIHLLAEDEQAQAKVKGVIIENTFTSVEDMASQIVPPLKYVIGQGRPFNCLVTNKWDNENVIGRIKLPMLLLCSLQDEMVPPPHMSRLRSAQRSPACRFVELPGAQHMDAYDVIPGIYWPELQGFLKKNLEDSE